MKYLPAIKRSPISSGYNLPLLIGDRSCDPSDLYHPILAARILRGFIAGTVSARPHSLMPQNILNFRIILLLRRPYILIDMPVRQSLHRYDGTATSASESDGSVVFQIYIVLRKTAVANHLAPLCKSLHPQSLYFTSLMARQQNHAQRGKHVCPLTAQKQTFVCFCMDIIAPG